MELRLAIRRLKLRPGATIVSIATLACAIGAATAAASVLGAVFFHPLAISSPSTLFVASDQRPDGPPDAAGFLYTEAEAVRDGSVFRQSAVAGDLAATVREGDEHRRVPVAFVSANYFDVVGVVPAMGRAFAAGEDLRGAPAVVVLSDGYWKRALNSDRSVIGQALQVGAVSATVVGIAPPMFRGLTLDHAPDLYVPLGAAEEVVPAGMNYFAEKMPGFSPSAWLHLIGRDPIDGQVAAAARLGSILRRPASATPMQLIPADVAAVPAGARTDVARVSRLLAVTTGLLLVIGSLTVGTLLLVRTETRREEFAIRLALGDLRRRMAAGVALEALVLAVTGAVLSWPIAAGLLRAVQPFELPGGLAIDRLDVALDGSALLVAFGTAAAAAAVMALVAGVFTLTASLSGLHEARKGATPPVTRRRTRAALVIAQVAAAMVLLCGAGLFARSLAAVFTLNPAIAAAHTVMTSINFGPRHWTDERAQAYYADLLGRLQRLPSVDAVGSTMNGVAMGSGGDLRLDGVPITLTHRVDYLAIDAGYLPALGLHVRSGRNFTEHDNGSGPRVALVSESLAARLADSRGNVIGRQFSEAFANRADEIVGVVPDVVTDVRLLHPLTVYQPIAQEPQLPYRTFLIRASNPEAAARDVLAMMRSTDPQRLAWPVRTVNEGMFEQLAPQRFGLTILGVLGAIAVLLTLLGAYVLAESASLARRRELGIRSALGAGTARLIALMMRDTVTLVGAGLVAGVGLVWLGANTIRALLFQTAPLDPATLASVAATILALTFVTSMAPAVRAVRGDLMTSLRDD